MAGTTSDLSLPNSSFFNIYHDGPLARNSPTLPGGQCNFVDLTRGANGPKCGCRRFWSRGNVARGVDGDGDQVAFCMCNHHACFHDDVRDGEQTQVQTPIAAVAPITPFEGGQENERPRASNGPLTPVIQDLSFPPPGGFGSFSMDFNTFNAGTSFKSRLPDDGGTPIGGSATPGRDSLPDTQSWINFIQTTPDHGSILPPIPSQCLMASQPSSTTSSARKDYMRPFAGKGLQTLSSVRSQVRQPVIEEEDDAEVALGKPAGVTDDDDGFRTVENTTRPPRHAGPPPQQEQPLPTAHDSGTLRQLSSTIQGHEERLDRLENTSFSASGHDDCHDKHEHADLRVTELEGRVEEVEKLLNDSSSTSSRVKPGVDESADSVVSISSSAFLSRAELYGQLQSLRAELSQLQARASPTYNSPWEVEVIFLPFPLTGLWLESHDFPSQRTSGGSINVDEWTQMPSSLSSMEPKSPSFHEWFGPEHESDWFLARACPPNKMIEKRLRSRGLVKTVPVRGPDARSVHQAITDAFGTLFRTFSRLHAHVHHGYTLHPRAKKYLGLQNPWVPLRKIHKDSRLRFLSPSEMITPAMWDVTFLTSSVVMKASGNHRLFITHPEAYLQDQDAFDNSWNWQRLRELSRVYPDSQSSQQDVPEADAMEDCWAWSDRLDESPSSVNSSLSLSLRQAAQPRHPSISPSQQFIISAESPILSASPTALRAGTRLRERKAFRPPHIRTTSMPPTVPVMASPALAKRRVASYGNGYERRPSPQVQLMRASTSTAIALARRRRSTRSPSIRNRNTPRWSTSSPSPMPDAFGERIRGTTPFAYATPYSNAPFVDTRQFRNGDAVIHVHEDENYDPEENRGSDTDPYDGDSMLEYTDDVGMLDDIDVYADPDEDFDEDATEEQHSSASNSFNSRVSNHEDSEEWQGIHGRQPPLPEDEPWPGIEDGNERVAADNDNDDDDDDEQMSDAENRVPSAPRSEASSQPSEYPSTQRAWDNAFTDGSEGFKIHEDGDGNGMRE